MKLNDVEHCCRWRRPCWRIKAMASAEDVVVTQRHDGQSRFCADAILYPKKRRNSTTAAWLKIKKSFTKLRTSFAQNQESSSKIASVSHFWVHGVHVEVKKECMIPGAEEVARDANFSSLERKWGFANAQLPKVLFQWVNRFSSSCRSKK